MSKPPIDHKVERTILADEISATALRSVIGGALGAARTMGHRNKKKSDQAAVGPMREILGAGSFKGRVVIGEGEMDQAPMLFIGEELGLGWMGEGLSADVAAFYPEVDIAVDPLEGTELCADGADGAISVIALSEKGGLLHAPDTYMMKIVVGEAARGMMDIDAPVGENLKVLARALNRDVADLVVGILKRRRHERLIQAVIDAGARVKLFAHGDLTFGIATAIANTNLHMTIGVGGAPEGVIAASALKCLNGDVVARLPKPDELTCQEWRSTHRRALERRMQEMGICKPTQIFGINDLAPGKHHLVAAAGITQSALFPFEARLFAGGNRVCTVLMATDSNGIHRFERGDHSRGGADTVFRM